jgi:hypothetical protein
MYLYPLWSAVVQVDVLQYGRDSKRQEGPVSVTLRSNAQIESHFKSVKHGRVDRRLRVRPSQFINKELTYIRGKLAYCQITETVASCKRPRNDFDLQDCEEVWKPRTKKPKYSTRENAVSILRKAARTRKRISKDSVKKSVKIRSCKDTAVNKKNIMSEDTGSSICDAGTASRNIVTEENASNDDYNYAMCQKSNAIPPTLLSTWDVRNTELSSDHIEDALALLRFASNGKIGDYNHPV